MKKQNTALQRTYINFQAWARDNNIYHAISPLNLELWGFVYSSKYGEYLIVVNDRLSNNMQKEVFCHEVEHILSDFPENSYFIGLDMQYSKIETRANEFASAVAETAANFFG